VLLGILTPQHCSWERDCDLGASRIFAICKDSTRILSVLSPCPRLGKQGGEWVRVSRVLIPIDRNSNRSVIRDPVAAFNEVFNMHCQCQRDFFVFSVLFFCEIIYCVSWNWHFCNLNLRRLGGFDLGLSAKG